MKKKIDKLKILNAEQINNGTLENLNNYKCLIIDNFENNIDENLFYSILNQSKQLENFVVVNSKNSLKESKINLKDLRSRLNSFIYIGIDLPTDDLLRVIISKSFFR